MEALLADEVVELDGDVLVEADLVLGDLAQGGDRRLVGALDQGLKALDCYSEPLFYYLDYNDIVIY